MNRLFPVIKHRNLSNGAVSLSVVLALYCQALAVNGEVRAGITVFLLVLLLNETSGALTVRLGQVTVFSRELGELGKFINFIVTPIVISCYMGFNGAYSPVFFVLFLLAGIWRLSDSGGTLADKSCVRGLRCAHAGALFIIAASAGVKIFKLESIDVFAPFFVITALGMISSFSYGRNGKLALSLYVLAPVPVILMWL